MALSSKRITCAHRRTVASTSWAGKHKCEAIALTLYAPLLTLLDHGPLILVLYFVTCVDKHRTNKMTLARDHTMQMEQFRLCKTVKLMQLLADNMGITFDATNQFESRVAVTGVPCVKRTSCFVSIPVATLLNVTSHLPFVPSTCALHDAAFLHELET